MTCPHIPNSVLPSGTNITSVKHIKKSRALAVKQRAPNIKEGMGGKCQEKWNYIYRGLANTEGEAQSYLEDYVGNSVIE